MTLLKSKLSLISFFLLAGLAIVGCASVGDPEVAEVVAPQSQIPITLISYNNGPEEDVELELIEQAQERYPELDVSREQFGTGFGAYLEQENPPEVITWFASESIQSFSEVGLLTDLSDLWRQEGWEAVYPETLQRLSQVEGRYRLLPTRLSWSAIYYNKALFESHNLAPPETWAEFLEVAERLKQSGITPIGLGVSNFNEIQTQLWLDYLNLRLNGSEFRQEFLMGETSFDTPQAIDIFTTWQTLVENGYFIDDPESYTPFEMYLAVADGQVAMTLANQSELLKIIPRERWGEVSFFRFPIIDSAQSIDEIVSVEGYVLPSNALEQKSALQFLAYHGSAEAQSYWTTRLGTLGGLPARTDIEPALYTADMEKAQQIVDEADYLASLYLWRDSPIIRMMYRQQVFYYLSSGRKPIGDIINDLEMERREMVK